MSDALKRGISRYMLYSLRDKGVIEQVSRGIYRLKELPPISNPDLVTVGLRFPSAVVCLVSALAFHEITTRIPRSVAIAVPRKSRIPSLDYPPITVHKFAASAYRAGIEEHEIDGVTIKIYDVEKTVVDCFKFRNQIGMDTVLEALKLYRTRKPFRPGVLLEYAEICRVDKVVRPYLEASV
ncbi:MAG: type IV toxin-antitoxin system AbiEi family antitoxin domain-containing protein [Rhodothermales bacterium]